MTAADLAALRGRLLSAERALLQQLLDDGLDRWPSPSTTAEIARIEATLQAIEREASR